VHVHIHPAVRLLSHQRQLVEGGEKEFHVGQKRRQVLGVGVVAQGGVEQGVEAAVLGVQLDRRRLVIGHARNGLSVRVLRPLETAFRFIAQMGDVRNLDLVLAASRSQQPANRHLAKSVRKFTFIIHTAFGEIVDAFQQIHVRGRRDHERGCAQQRLLGSLHGEVFLSLGVQSVFGEQCECFAECRGEL